MVVSSLVDSSFRIISGCCTTGFNVYCISASPGADTVYMKGSSPKTGTNSSSSGDIEAPSGRGGINYFQCVVVGEVNRDGAGAIVDGAVDGGR